VGAARRRRQTGNRARRAESGAAHGAAPGRPYVERRLMKSLQGRRAFARRPPPGVASRLEAMCYQRRRSCLSYGCVCRTHDHTERRGRAEPRRQAPSGTRRNSPDAIPSLDMGQARNSSRRTYTEEEQRPRVRAPGLVVLHTLALRRNGTAGRIAADGDPYAVRWRGGILHVCRHRQPGAAANDDGIFEDVGRGPRLRDVFCE
jgi:hypothetical protein